MADRRIEKEQALRLLRRLTGVVEETETELLKSKIELGYILTLAHRVIKSNNIPLDQIFGKKEKPVDWETLEI